jgi:tetratricopeptide (TPR) repeat protein
MRPPTTTWASPWGGSAGPTPPKPATAALDSDPDLAEAHFNLGNALRARGDPDGPVPCYREALRLKPRAAEVHYQLAGTLGRQGRRAESVAAYRDVLGLEPGHADARNNLGLALLEEGQPGEAVGHLREAARLAPQAVGIQNNFGLALIEAGETAAAAEHLRGCLGRWPGDPQLHNNLGIALRNLGRLDEGLASYREALRLAPDFTDALNNLGNALRDAGEYAEAEATLRRALALKPDFAEAHNNLGIALQRQGRWEEGMASYDRALALKPDYAEAHFNQALGRLQVGDFARGWPGYEWRWRMRGSTPRRFDRPAWDGSPLEGRTILLHAEQGLGDTLQFVRYAALLRRGGGRVVLECPACLHPLLAGCCGIDRLVPDGGPRPPFDVHAPLLSLPALCGTQPDTIPVEVPYLAADPCRAAHWHGRLGRGPALNVGVAWQGSRQYKGDRFRSIPLAEFAPLARAGVRLVSLQKGDGAEQLATLGSRFPVTDLGPDLDAGGAFVDTAAVMTCLDLVVSSDTAVAHLAGALGVPAWVAPPWDADWRWLRGRDDCPWYPTMRLFRQERPGDWEGVFRRIASGLEELKPARRLAVPVTVAPGELLDRLSVLEIAEEQAVDPAELLAVRRELAMLRTALTRAVPDESAGLTSLVAELKSVNAALWQAEGDLRARGRRVTSGRDSRSSRGRLTATTNAGRC